MNLILMPHNVTLTEAIQDHIIARIDKLEHLDRFALNVRVTLEHDQTKAPERQFSCAMRLSLPGPDLFAEDARRSPKRVIDAHPPDQRTQVRLDLRPLSLWAIFPASIATKAGPVPPHDSLRLDDREDLRNRREPSI